MIKWAQTQAGPDLHQGGPGRVHGSRQPRSSGSRWESSVSGGWGRGWPCPLGSKLPDRDSPHALTSAIPWAPADQGTGRGRAATDPSQAGVALHPHPPLARQGSLWSSPVPPGPTPAALHSISTSETVSTPVSLSPDCLFQPLLPCLSGLNQPHGAITPSRAPAFAPT